VTEWKEFRSPDFANIKATLKHPVIFVGRYMGDGRKQVAKSPCGNGQFLRAWCPLQLRWTHAHSRNSNAAGESSARSLQ